MSLSTPALVEMTMTILRRAMVTMNKARQPSLRPLSNTSWPRIACSRLTRTTRKFYFRRIHVKEPDQMVKSSTTLACCHGGKSSPLIFPFWLALPVPYSAFRIWIRCQNVHFRPPAIRIPTSAMCWSPTRWTPSSTSAIIRTLTVHSRLTFFYKHMNIYDENNDAREKAMAETLWWWAAAIAAGYR